MNTTKKGDILEIDVYNLISREIEANNFAFSQEHCRIFRGKGYYSKLRESLITFDVSIEVRLDKDQDDFSLLFLIECKNYSTPVPVNDIEEFFQKAQQVAAAAVKAIVISNGAFQRSAIAVARSLRMGLARLVDRSELEWVLHRSPSALAFQRGQSHYEESARRGIHEESYSNPYFDFFGYSNDFYTHSLNQFFFGLVEKDSEGDYRTSTRLHLTSVSQLSLVRYLDAHFIEQRALELLSQGDYKRGAAPLDVICKRLGETHSLVIENESLAPGVLGTIFFETPKISLDIRQCETSQRARFTIAHELGHLLLSHGDYMARDNVRAGDIELDKSRAIAIKDIVRMEHQANLFASFLLLPKDQLLDATARALTKLKIRLGGRHYVYLDDQPCNIASYHSLVMELGGSFGVSKTVVSVRLKQLGLLVERTAATTASAAADEVLTSLRKFR